MGTTKALFVRKGFRRNTEKNKNLYIGFVDLRKAFDRVPRRYRMGSKEGVPEILVWEVISMYDGTKTHVRVGNNLSEEF